MEHSAYFVLLCILQLQCYLQYWDPFCHYGGNFVTYTVFALSDSQINQYMLSKNNQQGPYGPISSSPTSSKGENNHVLQSNGLVTRSSSSNLSGSYGDESVHSSEPPTQPAAAVWRILVDLRVRTSSTTSNPSVNANYPIALARLTPMVLIGAIQIDTIHYPNNHIVGHDCLFRCQISNIKISLIEHQSTEHQNVGGFELSRCNLKDLDFLYKSNLSSFTNIHYSCDESIQFEIGQFSLLTADVNWSRMQQTMINNNLICCLSKQKLDILCKSLNIFISSDRLISLMILNKRIQQYISEFANILFQTENYQSSISDYTTSNNNSNLGWTLINYSNQFIVLDQLPLVKYLSANKTNQSPVEVDNSFNELFHVFIKPRQSVYWRPIVYPGPITSSGHAFRIKLRIGIPSNNGDNKVFLWSHPVELPWPLSLHKQHNDILCALSLKWEETIPCTTEVINGTFQIPELYLIICCTEPSGLPGKIILHSNVVVRNLLPVCLTCSLSTSTSNSLGKERSVTTGTVNKDLSKASNQHKTVDKNSQFTQQLFQIPTGPTMEFISTSADISSVYKSTHGCDLCICFKVNNDFYSDNQVQENNTLWSDPLNFKIPLPDQLNSRTETSHRTLIQLTLNNENNTSSGSSIFYAVITVEYYTTSFITPPICIITVSPLFEILNCIPIPLKLESKAIIPQQIINTNSSSIEIISPALFNHENWLTCQQNKNIRDLSNSYLHVLAKPIRLAYHYNLLLTGTLPNGESVLSHPIRLTGHEILKKLATTYMNYNNSILKHHHNNNSGEIFLKKSIQLNNSLPIISTLGIIPKFSFVNNSMNDYLDYLRNDNERKLIYSSFLQYSLRIVLRSQLLLINCSGIDLHLKFSSLSNDCSSYTDNNCEIPLQDNKCLVLSKTQRHFQLGVSLNNEIFWSETITIQPLNSSNESVEDNRKKNNDKDISALKLNEVIEISKEDNDNIPILWWNLSHTIDKSLFNTELLYCMQITLASVVQSPWSEVFPLHRVPNISHNKIHRNPFSSMPIFLSQVSIPIVSENSALNVYPSLLITTIKHKSTGQIIIQVDKNSILQNLNPFSIHIYNYTNSSIYSVELLDQLLSSSAKDLSTTKLFNDSMRNILKNTFLNWYPHKIYANSQLSIIPQCLLELLYMDKVNRSCNINDNNNTEGICLNFLHPSQFTKLELNLDVQQNDHVKDLIHINLKELCTSIHKTKGLWEKEKLINDHLLIKLYFSMNENSFGLIIHLHAMLRLYLSCHSAPLHFTSFKLINIENGYLNNNSKNNVDPYHHHQQQHDSNILSGSLIYWDSVKYLLTMHCITQILFRSGWLVGSLDLLGNVTGLLYSLINGLNDLIYLRSSNEDDENKDGENVTMIHLSDTNLFIRQQNIDFPSSTMAMSIGSVASDSTTFPLKYNRNVGFLYRLTQGLNSLTRRATGGLLLSISGIASSLARNLDYLSFDPHYEQHQDHIRRHHTPKGFSEGIQQGLSSLGLCLLSAIAGVADQPLQAIFKTMDNTTVSSDNIFNSSVDNQSTPNFLLSTLGGFGRGLVGVVTKPVAGAAELIAQTSKGLLHGTNNSVEMIIPSKYGEPYVSSEIGLRLQYQNVDVMILNYWGSIALRYVQPNISTSNYYDNQELSICSWFITEIYNHNNENYSIAQSHILNDTILWISASLDQNIVYASVITNEIDNSYFSWFKHFPNEVLKRFIDKVIRFDSKFVEIIDKSVNDKLSLVNTYNTSESDMSNSLNNWPFGISISDSWKWIDHIQFTSSNDIDCLKSIIQKFWLIDERLEKSTHQNSTELNSGSLQEQHTIPDSNSVDSKSDMNSADLFSSDRHNSRWKRVREYLIGMSSNDLIHI
ncbi:putative vacuolar protein sorting-associated protein (vps13b) [Schistosoma mansoni]|uniref:putative vacuolar protein sorting-associated protein (vps13b) n=1 Tax=Schistosoma mansoni TaxID=6183 RepID=UPI00022DC2AC|nr:putative vacuolar protein sorting-associated protein (vps13b) [Schistosoma mansoni]|eukprot:XP_018650939.1 putative vacuolar protein sorting-associated protein (vps13b) [Schistosoma mansoni]